MSWRDKGQPDIYNPYWLKRGILFRCAFSGRKRHWGGCLRHMRTTAEFRAYDPEFCRAKRSPTRLPDVREDYWRQPQRTWKVHRKTRFKPKEID
jgi:hypothetical protein